MSKNPTAMPRRTMIVIAAVAAVVGATVGSAVVKSLFQTQSGDSSVDNELAKVVDELNRNYPTMVDQFTRLDSMSALPPRKLIYKFTILNVDPLPSRETLVNNLRPQRINNYKTSQDMADLRKMMVTLVYIYADDKGNELARFEIAPHDIE